MHKLRIFTLGFAAAVFVLMVLAGPGVKWGWWPWEFGLAMLRSSAYAGIALAVVALILVALLAVPRWRVRPWVPILALCLALATVAPPMILLSNAKSVPPIHDITTDAADPPEFVALKEVRAKSPNGAAYGGAEVAREQRRAYADIKPAVIAQPPREAMQRAIDAARSLGWEVVASDAAAGRIEATATTRWFGFKDDVIVRIRPEAAGSRVDVRSVSRVGRGDLGANAARVRDFLAKIS